MEPESPIPPAELPPQGFTSRIPETLLADKTPDERFIYNEVSRMASFIEWAGPILVDCNHQARRTNGQVAQAKADILALKDAIAAHQKDTAPVVKAYGTAKKLVRSKLVWAGTLTLLGIGIPLYVKYAPDPLKIIAWAFTAVFS